MSTSALIDKIKHLPPTLNKDLEDYLGYLNARGVEESHPKLRPKTEFIEQHAINIYTGDDFDLLHKKPKLKRQFGGLKGFVTYISDNFDAPLDEFKDYM